MRKGFAIAAGHRLTAEAGADVLRAGGSAVDAGVAAALMAMVAEPVLAGLMGGGVAMIRPAAGSPRFLDAFVAGPRVKRPPSELDFRAISADFGPATQAFRIGAGTIAVSGLAAGLAEAHARFGRMPFRDLVRPAADAARRGVPLTPFQARLAEIVAPILTASPAARALHADGDKLRGAGGVFRNSDFADLLDEFGAAGPRFVQEGEVAAAVLALARDGGHLTPDDFAVYRPEWRAPVRRHRGADLALAPVPSLGGALIGFSLALAGNLPSPVEAARIFLATARARLETGLDREPEAGALALADPELVARVRAGFRGRAPAHRGTTQISAIDGEGLGIALTLSNGEGCGLIAPGTGIMPNNMLGEADLMPDGWHSWAPGRRLSTMMAPLSVEWPDGRVALMGSGGSNRIRTALAQTLWQLLDGGADLADAIAASRLHAEPSDNSEEPPEAVDFEEAGLGEADRAALLRAYPDARAWPEPSMFFGGVHAVLREAKGGLRAVGDPRRDGHAITG
ncbi:MAG: gamma-glutamyltransferase [Paracoccaceae bacterium]